MADQDQTRGAAAGIARGAVIIAGLTVLSRILGLVRTVVFSQRVGASCLGTAYITANQVPTLVYELVVGGALTSAMIPVLARSAERAGHDPQEKARVGHITSALLTWTVITLLPLTILVAAASALIAGLLNPANAHAHCARTDVVGVTAGMLAVFAPQIILSGISVVLYGLLQAYRRFVGPALGPAVSSLVVISAYLAFAPADRDLPLSRLPLTAELILSVGTTLGVAALLAVALFPNMSRVMMALGQLRVAAVAVAGSWLVVIAADAVLATVAPPRLVVAALALGNSLGQTVVAVPLVLAARRIRGPEAVRGTGRAALAGGAAGLAAAALGVAVSLALPADGKVLAAGVATLAAAGAALAFGLVAYLLNDGDLRAASSWLRQVTKRVPDGVLCLPARSYASPPSPGGSAGESGAPTASCSSPATAGACPLPCPSASTGMVSAKARLAIALARPSTPREEGGGTPFGSSEPGPGSSAGTCLASSTARLSSFTGLCTSMNSPFGSCLMMPVS